MRIAIFGNSGSGKSTLAGELAAANDLAVLDLDTVAWESGQIAVSRSSEAAIAAVQDFCVINSNWVVEGCYSLLIAATLQHMPYLLFLEPGLEQCLNNCRNRPWEPHKYKSKAEQDQYLDFLLTWVTEYYTRQGDISLSNHRTLFDNYAGPKQILSEGVYSVGMDMFSRGQH